ncbi:2,3-diaminopropionate biosynthesis protein SbnB [Microbacterium sp. K2]|uniref:2,3-diaminopropionate biosynthesis protein SbnB n=1 Tax=Microbacterium sp. K2 TaxID=3391827 RepID=UPI003ED935E5
MFDTKDLTVIGADRVDEFLRGRETEIIGIVEDTYLTHNRGETVNPDSYFLRFPEQRQDRIIALPAHIAKEGSRSLGIKWISSFPANVERGLQRASAVIILNDPDSGFATALIEGSRISAARTAASAALAVRSLHGEPSSIGVVGSGPIARAILRFIGALYPTAVPVRVHDLNPDSVARMIAESSGDHAAGTLDEVMAADVVVFATSAGTPYVSRAKRFQPGQLVLNVSLRDLAPETLRDTNNIFDDVEHCLKANTTPHLLEQMDASRDFVTGTLAQVIEGDVELDPTRATVFSPFGLGVLDLAISHALFEQAKIDGSGVRVTDFHGEMGR